MPPFARSEQNRGLAPFIAPFTRGARTRKSRLVTLDWPQFVVLGLGLCAIHAILAIILMRDIGEALIRAELKHYEREFGFVLGLVPGSPLDGPRAGWWGVASVTPGGWMDRAGVRNGDVVFDRHGYGLATLLWAIEQAASGQTACFVVVGTEDGRRHDRDVCLDGQQDAKVPIVIDAPRPAARTGVCEREGYALAREAPRRIGDKMSRPMRLHYTTPEFPHLPETTVGSGSWTGEVLIDRSGTVRHVWPIREVQLTPPFPAFNASIVEAIRHWQYEPSWFAGQPVSVCTHRLSACSQLSIVAGGGHGQVDAAGIDDFELPKVTEHTRGLRGRRNALEHFAEDQIRQAEPLASEFAVEPVGLGRRGAFSGSRPTRWCR